MKNFKFPPIAHLLLTILFVFTCSNCKKEEEFEEITQVDPPSISSSEIFSLGSNAVTILSNIKKNEDVNIITQDIEWSLKNDPLYIHVTEVSTVDSSFYCRISNLEPEREYTARSFIKHNEQLIYGEDISFTTNGGYNRY